MLLRAAAGPDDDVIEPYWLHSSSIASGDDVAGFDGVWVVPGSPYADSAGVIRAVHAARTRAIPFLGTCGGFQHQLLEYARHVCGLAHVDHAETSPDGPELLLVPLACKLYGEEARVDILAGTRAAEAMGAGQSTERYFCSFGLNPAYEETLTGHGLVISGRDDSGEARVAELPGHPFYVGALFQPELSSDSTWVHPLITAFLRAVRLRAAAAHRELSPA